MEQRDIGVGHREVIRGGMRQQRRSKRARVRTRDERSGRRIGFLPDHETVWGRDMKRQRGGNFPGKGGCDESSKTNAREAENGRRKNLYTHEDPHRCSRIFRTRRTLEYACTRVGSGRDTEGEAPE